MWNKYNFLNIKCIFHIPASYIQYPPILPAIYHHFKKEWWCWPRETVLPWAARGCQGWNTIKIFKCGIDSWVVREHCKCLYKKQVSEKYILYLKMVFYVILSLWCILCFVYICSQGTVPLITIPHKLRAYTLNIDETVSERERAAQRVVQDRNVLNDTPGKEWFIHFDLICLGTIYSMSWQILNN